MREIRALRTTMTTIEDASALDAIAVAEQSVIDAIVPKPSAARDLLHGVPAGHPLHPVLVLAPLGAWISASLLDFVPGTGRASRTLTGFGILAAVPAAATGFVDWSELDTRQQRTGIVHSLVNATAIVLYTMSWRHRRQRRHLRGALFGLAGLTVVSVGGYLGGHLSYRQRAGVSADGSSVPFSEVPSSTSGPSDTEPAE